MAEHEISRQLRLEASATQMVDGNFTVAGALMNAAALTIDRLCSPTPDGAMREALELANALIGRMPSNGENWEAIMQFEAAYTAALSTQGKEGERG